MKLKTSFKRNSDLYSAFGWELQKCNIAIKSIAIKFTEWAHQKHFTDVVNVRWPVKKKKKKKDAHLHW